MTTARLRSTTRTHGARRARQAALALSALLALALATTAAAASTTGARTRVLVAVAAESQYASAIRQIGGAFVVVRAVISNPTSDPHSYEATQR